MEKVGGLYGVLVGGVFAGESMFAHVSNASKVVGWAVRQMAAWGVEMDRQGIRSIYTFWCS